MPRLIEIAEQLEQESEYLIQEKQELENALKDLRVSSRLLRKCTIRDKISVKT